MLCIGWYYRPDTRYKYQGKSKQEVPTREHVEIKLLLPHLIVVRSLIKCKYRALETLSTENGSIGWADCIDVQLAIMQVIIFSGPNTTFTIIE